MATMADRLNQLHDQVTDMMHANCNAVRKIKGLSDKEIAGVLLLMATTAVSHAAFSVAKTDPALTNTPPERQIANFLDLIREVMTKPQGITGGWNVVLGGKCAPPEQEGRG
jgi:hypothetical protein